MKGLLVKDIRLLLGQKQFYIVVLGIGILFTCTNSLGMGVSYITGLLTYFTVSTISYDEVENGMSYLMTLPIVRKQYAQEKYLFAGILSVVGAILASFIGIIVCLVNSYVQGITEVLMTAGVMLPVCWLTMAVLIPIQIKFGPEKGRFAMLAGFAIISVVIFGGLRVLEFTGLGFALVHLDTRILVAVGAIAFILVLLASYRISIRIILKKEY